MKESFGLAGWYNVAIRILTEDTRVLTRRNTAIDSYHEMPEPLPTIVAEELGVMPTSCRLVTRLIGPHPRRAYRVTLADGRLVKVRQFSSDDRAAEVGQFIRHLNGHHVPCVLAQKGPVLILDWIDGLSLAGNDLPESIYTRAGQLLAWLHMHPIAVKSNAKSKLARTDARIRTDAGLLRYWGVLDAGDSERLVSLLHGLRPREGEICLAHGDFCGENLVLTADGTLCSVDNEALGFDFPEMDLARAILRWKITTSARKAFLLGYEMELPDSLFRIHERYWTMVSLIRSIRYRYRCEGADYSQELAHLKILLNQGKH
jgi:aminoglycoside phosphotransferase